MVLAEPAINMSRDLLTSVSPVRQCGPSGTPPVLEVDQSELSQSDPPQVQFPIIAGHAGVNPYSGLVACRGATITSLRICCYGHRSEPLRTQ